MAVKSGTINSFSTNKAAAIEAYLDWSTELVSGNTYTMTVSMYCHVDNWGSSHTRDVSYEWYVNDGSVAIGTASITCDQQYYKVFTTSFEIITDDDGYWSGWMYGSATYYSSSFGGNLVAEISDKSPITNLKAGRSNYSVYYYTGYGSNELYDTQSGFDNGDTCNVIDSNPSRASSSLNTQFTITGNKNGGDVNVSATATKKTTTKYTFKGWSKTNGATTADYTSTSTFTVNGNVTLYGVWSSSTSSTYSNNTIGDLPDPTRASIGGFYNITLISNNGQESTIIEAGSFTKYTFKGWASSSTSTTALAASKSYTSGTTVYAIWSSSSEDKSTVDLPIPSRDIQNLATYTVTLNPNGGSVNPTSKTTSKIKSYTFKGWSTVSGNISNIVSDPYTPTNKTSHSLYAIWSEMELIDPISLPSPTYPSFKFLGWGINANSTSYVPMTYTPNQDITLYAIYKASYTGEPYVWHNGAWHRVLPHLRYEDVFNGCINAT